MNKTYSKLLKGIKQYFKKSGFAKAVIGVSGGIDSALSLKLVADALGSNNVTALLMPESGLDHWHNLHDARDFCKKLNVDSKIIHISLILDKFRKYKQNHQSWTNLKPRIRAVLLYNYANANNASVIGTSNKTELALGYFTKHGDGACDIEVIGDLYKTEVLKLAKYLKLPEHIINKTPSADLFKGQTDEGEIGETYANIDLMLQGKKKMSKRIKELIEKNKHKTQPIPIIKTH